MTADLLFEQCQGLGVYSDVAALSSKKDILNTVAGSESPKSEQDSQDTQNSPSSSPDLPERGANTRHGERQRLQASLHAEVEYLKSFNKHLEQEHECLNNYVYQLRVMLFDMKYSPYSDYLNSF